MNFLLCSFSVHLLSHYGLEFTQLKSVEFLWILQLDEFKSI